MKPVKVKNRLKESTKNNINGFLFALPWIVGFLFFSVYPLFTSLYYSFTEFNPIMPAKWVGLENYQYIFKDPLFYKSLGNTLFFAFVATPINLGIAILLATLINKKFMGRGLARTIFFIPSVIPMVAATMVWIWMFDPSYGFINNFLRVFGIDGPAWLIDPRTTKWALVMMGSWCVGTTMLICLAALQDVPKSYYESAEIDGANSIVQFFKITMPCVAHVIVYQAILNLINAFQYFTQVYVITTAAGGVTSGASGGPENSILMYPLYLFHNAFVYMKMGRASAMAWVLFFIVGALTIVMVKLTKKTTDHVGGE
jgi:multiple sugar transport system permease protein